MLALNLHVGHNKVESNISNIIKITIENVRIQHRCSENALEIKRINKQKLLLGVIKIKKC